MHETKPKHYAEQALSPSSTPVSCVLSPQGERVWVGGRVVCLGTSRPVLSQEEPTRNQVRETVSVSINTNSVQYAGTVLLVLCSVLELWVFP